MAAINVEVMPRIFKYKDLKLNDPNPTLTVAEVIEFYSKQYPELTNGFEENSTIEGGKEIVNLKTSVGTKG